MRTITAFIKRHAVLTYYALVFAISWGGVLVVVGPTRIPGHKRASRKADAVGDPGVPRRPQLWEASLLTGFVYWKGGPPRVLSRLLKWRVAARWYAAALLTAPLLMMAVLLALSLFSREFVPAYSHPTIGLPFCWSVWRRLWGPASSRSWAGRDSSSPS